MTLFGFSLLTFCASVCPMNMGMTTMSSMDMQMKSGMNHAMAQTEKKTSPCKKCDHKSEVVAAIIPLTAADQLTNTVTMFAVPQLITESFLASMFYTVPFIDTGPPFLTASLVGTVILRV